jgi:hypothetical protein
MTGSKDGYPSRLVVGAAGFSAFLACAGRSGTDTLLCGSGTKSLRLISTQRPSTRGRSRPCCSPQTQMYAISVNAGVAITDAFIVGNDLHLNGTGAFQMLGTVAGCIANNKGYNPLGPVSETPAASPWTYTAGNTPENLKVSSTTVTMTKNSIALPASAGFAECELQPGESVIVEYTGTPTAVTDRR